MTLSANPSLFLTEFPGIIGNSRASATMNPLSDIQMKKQAPATVTLPGGATDPNAQRQIPSGLSAWSVPQSIQVPFAGLRPGSDSSLSDNPFANSGGFGSNSRSSQVCSVAFGPALIDQTTSIRQRPPHTFNMPSSHINNSLPLYA